MKKKLCMVIDLFPPKYKGGTEMIALEMAKQYSKTYDVHVVTKWHERLNENKVDFKIHGIKIKKKLFSIRFIGSIGPFLKEIKKLDPDIIYTRPFTPAGLISVIYCKKYNIPVVAQCEGGDIRSNWLKFYEKIIVKYVIKNSTKIVSATEEMKNIIKNDYGRDDVIVIQNGVNIKHFKRAKPKKMNYDKPRILFIGRMDEMKGTEYLIKAFLDLRKIKNASLILIGKGPLENNLKKRYGKIKNIFFLGEISHKSVPSYMKSSDVLVLPAIDEAQGLILMEGMASGLPIIASKVGGIPELIKKGNGILTKPKNSQSIKSALIRILTDKKVAKTMKRNNIKKAELHSWENICKKYVRLFNELID